MSNIKSHIRKLNSIFPWVRRRALNNLVEIGLPAVKEIMAALDTPYAPIGTKVTGSNHPDWDESMRAVERWDKLLDVLVRIGQPALAELEDALRHRNPNVRISAMHAIGKIGHPSAVDLLLPFTHSKKRYEREWAVAALGFAGSSRDFETLVAALDDKDIYVRESAILALGELGDTRALPKLEQIAALDRTRIENYGRTLGDVAKEAVKKIRKKRE